jgi:hypothetical protein
MRSGIQESQGREGRRFHAAGRTVLARQSLVHTQSVHGVSVLQGKKTQIPLRRVRGMSIA